MKLNEITSAFLFKGVQAKIADVLNAGKTYTYSGNKFLSTTRKQSDISPEFGEYIVKINVSKLPKNCKIIDVVYTWGWFQSHPDICLYVTGKTPKQWIEWSKESYSDDEEVWNNIEDEIVNNYSDEKETIITGLTELNPAFCSIVK